jgi:predicted small lipoprotein YifL
MNKKYLLFFAFIIMTTTILSSCGQKGSLYLPDTDDTTIKK